MDPRLPWESAADFVSGNGFYLVVGTGGFAPPSLTARFRFSAHLRDEDACAPFQITAAS